MRKGIFLILSLYISLLAIGQTQHGYVKTKGRMVNGQLIPGEGLKGAVVAVKGRL